MPTDRSTAALELSADYMPVLDPVTNTASRVPLTVRDPNTPPTSAADAGAFAVLGRRSDLDQQEQRAQSDARSQGTGLADVRGAAAGQSRRLQGGFESSVGEALPARPARAATSPCTIPQTKKLTHIGTCFGTHHLMFAEDANHTLWTSGGGQVIGWLNTKMFDETHDEMKSQGWTALIRDANGNGKRDAYVEPDQPLDPTKDQRIGGALYAVAPAPDGSVWGTRARLSRAPSSGSRPGEPARDGARGNLSNLRRQSERAGAGFSPRGGDVDRNGVVLGGAGERPSRELRSPQVQRPAERSDRHRSALSRRLDALCRAGAAVQGRRPIPAAPRRATTPGSISSTRSGSGTNMPIDTGNAAEALLALKDGKFVTLRVPYPIGFYTKWMDGRIDDPNARLEGPRHLDDGVDAERRSTWRPARARQAR